jgi:hypothetical protein
VCTLRQHAFQTFIQPLRPKDLVKARVIFAHQVVAMVSTDGVWVLPRAKRDEAAAAHARFAAVREGDHVSLLAVARAFAAVPRRQQATWCHENFLNYRCAGL